MADADAADTPLPEAEASEAAAAPAAAAAKPPPLDAATVGGEAASPTAGGKSPAAGAPATPSSPLAGIMQFASLYIGDLHPDIGEAMLYEAFSSAGTVASCRVCRDSVTRKSLGYGYVNYYSVAHAERALETLNYVVIKGKPCRLMWSQRDPASRRNLNSNVYVKQLDPSIDNKALHDTFSMFGNILSCKVSTDNNGKSRCYGFVHYETEDAAKLAIEKANGMKIGDSVCFVGPFIKREEKEERDMEKFTNLYVKHFPHAWDEDKLTSVFAEFGEVASVWLSATDDGKRFALVNMSTSEAAKAAVNALHRKDMTSEGLTPEAEAALKATEEAKAAKGGEEEAKAAKDGEEEAKEVKEDGEQDKDAGAEKAGAVANDQDAEAEECPLHCLYVQRAQTRAERKAALEAERKKRKGAGKGAAAKKTGMRLCIKNLGEETSEQSLRELFEPFGKLLNVSVRLSEEGKCKGIGFVVFASMEEAAEATKELHLKIVGGKPLNVGVVSDRRRRDARGDEEDDGRGAQGGGKGREKGGKGKGGRGGESGRGGGKGGKGKGKDVPPLPYGGAPPVPTVPPNMLGVPQVPLSPAAAYPQGRYALPGYPPAAGYPGYAARGVPPMPGALPAGYPLAAARGYGGAVGPPPPAAAAAAAPQPGGGLPPHLVAACAARAPRPQQPPQQNSYPYTASTQAPLPPPGAAVTREALSQLPPQLQKQRLGERLYGLVQRHRPDLAGKITGMILELDNNEILGLIESDGKLQAKVSEAVRVWEKKSVAA